MLGRPISRYPQAEYQSAANFASTEEPTATSWEALMKAWFTWLILIETPCQIGLDKLDQPMRSTSD